MHIGYDISQTGNAKAGCGYFAHAMLQAMFKIAPHHQCSLYPSFGNSYFDPFMPLRNPYIKGKYGPRHFTRESAEKFWKKSNLDFLLRSPDIIHANNYWCPVNLRTSRLIYTLYDLSFMIEPSWTTEVNRQNCFKGVLCASLYADGILAISESTLASFLELFPYFPTERIKVIYPCSRFEDRSIKDLKPKILEHQDIQSNQFWLSVGTIEPRKNQKQLCKAYARYHALSKQPLPLVLAGGKGWMMDDFQDLIDELGIKKDVILTGYISDKELIWLYRNCYANIYASLYEGFGLPVLEGMQFGATTMVSASSSLPEVVGSAAILLCPKDTDSWTHAMLELEKKPSSRIKWKEKAFAQSSKFNWNKSASQLLEFYADIINIPKRTAVSNHF